MTHDNMDDVRAGFTLAKGDELEAAKQPVRVAALAAKIERLLARVEELEADALAASRLAGMGSEREARLMARVAELEGEASRLDSWLGLMELLDRNWPADIVTGISGDLGARMVVKIRELELIRKEWKRIAAKGAWQKMFMQEPVQFASDDASLLLGKCVEWLGARRIYVEPEMQFTGEGELMDEPAWAVKGMRDHPIRITHFDTALAAAIAAVKASTIERMEKQ